MCFGLGLTKLIFGDGGAGAAKKQAKAQALQSQLATQGVQLQKEAQINQDKASQAAAALLNKPIDPVDVAVGEPTATETDPTSGRKRTPRSSFQIAAPSSGLAL